VNGVAVDLGKFIAVKLGVAFDPVVYANQEAYVQSFGKGGWDIVIGVRSALAEEKTDMSPDFMVADAMYIAAPGREFADATKIDRPGVKVGVSQGGGSDQILSRALKSAQVVRVPGGVPNAVQALRTGTVDVWPRTPLLCKRLKMRSQVPKSSPVRGLPGGTRRHFPKDDRLSLKTNSLRSWARQNGRALCKRPSNGRVSRAFALRQSNRMRDTLHLPR